MPDSVSDKQKQVSDRMLISSITEYLTISSKVTEKNVDAILDLDPKLVISMIFQRRPPHELVQPPRIVLWLRTFDFPLLPIPLRTLNRGVLTALPVIQDGHHVHVFCEGGRRRSVAMASCILISQSYTAEEAMRLVREKREVAEAAQVIVSEDSTVHQIDVGQCDAAAWVQSRYFLLRVASGFDAQRINMTSRELRDKYGRMAYFVGALQTIPESKAVRYTFTLDGEAVEVEGFTCLVENAGNMGVSGVSLASDVSISDGLLDVFCVYNLDFNSLTSMVKSITNKPLDPESFRHWRAQEVTIESDSPQPVVGDGEKWGETPVTVRVLPGAISVIVPADAT